MLRVVFSEPYSAEYVAESRGSLSRSREKLMGVWAAQAPAKKTTAMLISTTRAL
jgi:hypothetical protein